MVCHENGSRRGARRLALTLAPVLALLGGCVGTIEDYEVLQRDVQRLRQEVAGMSRSNQAARALIEERLGRLEGDPRPRPDAPAAETGPPAAALHLRLEELAREVRFMQGKLEENAGTLGGLQRRVDEALTTLPGMTRRLDRLEQQARTPAAAPPPAAAAPPPPAPPVAASPPPAPPQATAAPGAAPAVPAPTARASLPRATLQSALPPEEVYKNALGDYTRGDYELAINGFRTYLANYPKTSLASNAQYWLAESYLSQRNYPQAVEEFDAVIRDHPDSAKVASALFKQGEAYFHLNDSTQGTKVLCQLVNRFPKTREARLARERNLRCP
jgi:tol-pal system protein YbgF